MSVPEFPYRVVLQNLTEVVNGQGLDPFEACAVLATQEKTAQLQRRVYPSTSITSGGHRRDESIDTRTVIARNTRSALMLTDQLAADGQIASEHTIEPVMVGKTHWDQGQFMEFWLSVTGGFELTPGFLAHEVDDLRNAANQAYDRVGLDRDLLLSDQQPEARAPEYFKMATAFAGLVEDGRPARPIETLIRLIDPDKSLGAQTERVFARSIGSRVMNVSVVRPATPDSLRFVNPRLAEDTARLIQFGATVFDTRESSVRLILTEATDLEV